MRAFYRSLWGLAALVMVSFEVFLRYGSLATWILVLIGIGAVALTGYAISTLLIPGLRLLGVPSDATVHTFSDAATFTVLADSPVEVVLPSRLAIRRAGLDEPVPKVVPLGFAAAPVAVDVSELPQESWREPTFNESLETLRRGAVEILPYSLILTFPLGSVAMGVVKSLHVGALEKFYWSVVIFFFTLMLSVLTVGFLRPRQKPVKIRIVRDAIVDDRKVAWAEFVGNQARPWTVEGEPADWRKR